MKVSQINPFYTTNEIKKKTNIDENQSYWKGKFSYFLSNLWKFNEIFKKIVSYDNFESHKKQDFILSPENAFLEEP